MKTAFVRSTLTLTAVCLFCGAEWRQFRGNYSASTSSETGLPISFGEKDNVAWKVPLPGRGPSGPIVVGSRVVVTCSSGTRGDRLHAICFDAGSGRTVWHRQLWATGHTECHPFGAVATPTPASDGKLIVAFYSSNDLACFDLEGNLKWFRGLAYENPTTRNDVGMSSSPLLSGRTVIVQLENQGESFAAGIDTATGQTRWRHARQRDSMWASPILLPGKTPAEDVVLMQSRTRLTGHRAESGEHLFDYEAGCSSVSSATSCGGRIYLPVEGLDCLQFDPAAGKVKRLWTQQRLRSANASPLVHDGRVYTMKSPGILVCGNAADGAILWQLRLKGPFWATPVLADGKIYAVNHGGLVQVVELGEKGKLLGSNQIDAPILASPAVAGRAIYFRSDRHLWKVATEK